MENVVKRTFDNLRTDRERSIYLTAFWAGYFADEETKTSIRKAEKELRNKDANSREG